MVLNSSIKEAKYPSLKLKSVDFSWPCGTKALNQCTFSIPHPGLWMLVGKNGSGKSSLFRVLSGLSQAQSGQIHCALKPALVFQNPDHQLLLPSCSADLMLSLPTHLNKKERLKIIKDVLKQVDLVDMESRPIHTLSGGQKQRLAIAGALASQANLLLLDEPTALLDPSSQKAVLEKVWGLCHRKDNPLTALWITHRLAELDLADGAATMTKGSVGPWKTGNQLKKALLPLAAWRV